MAQITDLIWADRTDVAWNWKTNLLAMNAIMKEKQSDYHRFIGYYRDSYGHQTNWVEPPLAYKLKNLTLSAEAWGVMTLFNGAGGLPSSSVPTHSSSFASPWIFNPSDGTWTLKQNQNKYTKNVDEKSNKPTRE